MDAYTVYSYQVFATDADNDVLSYSLSSSSPSWLSINVNTGLISGTSPSVTQDTQYVITVQVDDN
ncbi:MAG: putative Ig domain-containing protein, partial [Bacteroidetes bacterium]|nr:putative Ig domain-containing protein [Bacteroidota bacterium]